MMILPTKMATFCSPEFHLCYSIGDEDDDYDDQEDHHNVNVEYADAKDDDCDGDQNRPISGSAI